MKKKKLNILLNIVTICLCVCAIAIGVYSVKNASLAVTGTINFQAHDCLITVKAEMYGDAVSTDGTPDKAGTPRKSTDTLASLGTWSNVKDDANNNGTNKLSSDTKFYFSDMGESGEVEDITVVFTIINNSEFPVKAMISSATSTTLNFYDSNTVPFDSSYSVGQKSTTTSFLVPASTIVGTMPAKSDTCTLVVNISLKDKTKDSDANTFDIGLSFEKYSATTLSVETGDFRSYTADGYTNVSRSYVKMGKVGSSDIKWFVFAQSDSKTGTMKPVTGEVVTSGSNLPKGTYWFVSEWALGSRYFQQNDRTDGATRKNQYKGSDLQKYLSGENSSDSFLETYKITSADADANSKEIYNKISNRTLQDDSAVDGIFDPFVVTENQKLWEPSCYELYLIHNLMLVNDYNYNGLLYAVDETCSQTSYWTRTLYGGSYMPFGIRVGNYYTYYEAGGDQIGVRPAFQITI